MIIKFNGYDIIATIDEVRALLTDAAPEKVIVQAPEMDPEPEPKKTNKKIPLDMGKVKALGEAGWTVEKIADDMKVSPATIYARLKEERESNE